MLYAKSTGGFYHPEINSGIPSDAVEISDDLYREILSGQSEGMIIAAGEDGIPLLSSPPEPPLADVKERRNLSIKASCGAAITGGFTSSALGGPHTYPSDQNSQANLAANVLSSMYPDLKADWITPQLCADAEGDWVYRPHTAAQIQQVGLDGKAAILACLTRIDALRKAIDSAADVAAVQAINW